MPIGAQGFVPDSVTRETRVGMKKCCRLVAACMNGSLQRYASGYFICTRLQGLCVATAPKKSTAGGEPIKSQLGQTGDKPASEGEVA